MEHASTPLFFYLLPSIILTGINGEEDVVHSFFLCTCKALIQASRTAYNSSYTTTIFSNQDNDFNFEYAQFDQLQFNEEQVDNQLTALFAYYAYLIIGFNLDTYAPMGGEDVLQRCMTLANNSQNLNYTGWKGV